MEHDAIVGLDGIMRCRLCGKIGEEIVGILAVTQSLSQARRILGEVAVLGGWQASSHGEYAMVYSRNKGGIEEELSIKKKSTRQWLILKEIRQT